MKGLTLGSGNDADKTLKLLVKSSVNSNSTQVAIRAKYAKKLAEVAGFKNIRKAKIQKRLAAVSSMTKEMQITLNLIKPKFLQSIKRGKLPKD